MRTDSLSICGISSLLNRNTTHSLANGSFMIIKGGFNHNMGASRDTSVNDFLPERASHRSVART